MASGAHRIPFLWPGVVLMGALALAGCGPSDPAGPGAGSRNADARASAALPTLFEDATARFQLGFTNDSSATGRYLMWEQMASGGALFDFDDDGLLDLYLVQGGGPSSTSRNRLFHQEAAGTLRDVSAGSGLDVTGYGMGAYAGDVNNDGRPDLLLTEYGAARLFLNRGEGRFTEVTAAAKLDNPRWAVGASFLDYDRDGWLDLVVVNYLDYDPARACKDYTGVPEYCGPQDFTGTVTRLFHNRGAQPDSGIELEDVTVESGLAGHPGPGLGVLCADFDGDRWIDILVTDDGKPNRLFINRRDGTFAEEAAQRGIAYNAVGAAAGNMGIAVGDVDGDGLPDILVTHLAHEQHSLWRQGPRGLFQDRAAESGLVNPRWRGTGFGAVFADFDLDGSLDLAFVNGRVLRGSDSGGSLPGLHALWQPYAQRAQVFVNDGHGRFADASEANPAFSGRAGVGRGLLMGDLDNDGAVDLITTCTGGPAQIYRNTARRRGHWLSVRVRDSAHGDRDAIGAEVVVRAGQRRWWGLVQPASSFLSSHDPRVHFGLGATDRIESIVVTWPDGAEETFAESQVDRHYTLRSGRVRNP